MTKIRTCIDISGLLANSNDDLRVTDCKLIKSIQLLTIKMALLVKMMLVMIRMIITEQEIITDHTV